MKSLEGISFIDSKKYKIFIIRSFSDEMKNELANHLSYICNGISKAESGERIYDYYSTLNEFLKRYSAKSSNIKKGLIGELLAHFLILFYVDDLQTVTPFFNIGERSIKKGFDIVLTDKEWKEVWLTEVKSGEKNKEISSNQLILNKINEAKNDMLNRLKNENNSTWEEAINGAKLALEGKNSLKQAVESILRKWQYDSINEVRRSEDKNAILVGVAYANLEELLSEKIIMDKQGKIEDEAIFNRVIVIAIQKATYIKIEEFLENEGKNNG